MPLIGVMDKQPQMPGALHHSEEVLVIGAGALGGYLAAQLADSGQRVSVVARGQRRADIEQHGILLDMDNQRRVVRINCHTSTAKAQTAGLVIIATKSASLGEVLAELGSWHRPARAVLTLQNGVDAPDHVALGLPTARVLAGRVHGFFVLVDGVVVHTGVPPEIGFGPWRSADNTDADLLAARFTAAGIPFSRPSDIAAALWEKFLLASAIGGVGAALGIPVGRLRESLESWSLLGGAMQEIHELAVARGVQLPEGCVASTLDFVAGFPQEATSSLQRDLLERRESEFAVLTGAVVRMGREFGLHQPAHDRILDLLTRNGLLKSELVSPASRMPPPRLSGPPRVTRPG